MINLIDIWSGIGHSILIMVGREVFIQSEDLIFLDDLFVWIFGVLFCPHLSTLHHSIHSTSYQYIPLKFLICFAFLIDALMGVAHLRFRSLHSLLLPKYQKV